MFLAALEYDSFCSFVQIVMGKGEIVNQSAAAVIVVHCLRLCIVVVIQILIIETVVIIEFVPVIVD